MQNVDIDVSSISNVSYSDKRVKFKVSDIAYSAKISGAFESHVESIKLDMGIDEQWVGMYQHDNVSVMRIGGIEGNSLLHTEVMAIAESDLVWFRTEMPNDFPVVSLVALTDASTYQDSAVDNQDGAVDNQDGPVDNNEQVEEVGRGSTSVIIILVVVTVAGLLLLGLLIRRRV